MNEEPKRSDVGYKRPPREHQFKKGNKPAPRKLKPPSEEGSMAEVLWKVLNEDVRVLERGQVRYRRAADILVQKVFSLAESGNSSMGKLALDLLMLGEAPGDDEPETYLRFDRLDGSPVTEFKMETGYGEGG